MSDNEKIDLLNSIVSDGGSKTQAEIEEIISPLKREVDLIPNGDLRSFVRCILVYANYFWNSPSSNVPEIYPPDEYTKGGMVLHTKRTVWAMFCILNAKEVSEEDFSVAIAAAILHNVARPLLPNDPENGMESLYDPNYMVNIDQFIIEAFQIGISEKTYPTLTNEAEIRAQELLNRVVRLIHCSEGTLSPIRELFPENTLEVMFASAQIVAKSLHIIVDGVNVIEERWQFETQPEN